MHVSGAEDFLREAILSRQQRRNFNSGMGTAKKLLHRAGKFLTGAKTNQCRDYSSG